MAKFIPLVQGARNTPGRHHARRGRAAPAGVERLDGQGRRRPARWRCALRRPHRCCRRWLTTSASDLNGYTIVQAPDLAAAKTLCGGNPFLDDATADFVVEIYELAPM